jgi:hypothetical protein
VPGRFKVIRHVRAKLSCRACDAVVAAPAPDHAITRGRPHSDRYDYGFLPPRFYNQVLDAFVACHRAGKANLAPRD